ncbi:hypothetical protein FC90_GL000750 [Latilactobacillus graminis DSM 20719]|uniref:Uncharacterized protein n=2 Tax=Latilactobacillus graminis TaxID=60519 RepID=A0AA89I3G6_9LACO|nr:hypothetical protein FC90_GL000750 [Latilactobacillus graminis DSM 20719]
MELQSRLNQRQSQVRPHRHLSRFLTFLIFLCVFCGIGGMILNQTVLKEAFTQEQLSEPRTLAVITDKINVVLLDAAQKNGLPTEVQVQLLTKADVKADLTKTIHNVYTGQEKPLPTTQMMKQLAGHLTAIIPDNALTKVLIDTAVAAVQPPLQEYLTNQIEAPYLTPLATELQFTKNVVNVLMWVAIILGIVLALVQWGLSGKFMYLLESIGISFAWSGLLLTLMSAAIKYSGLIEQVAQKAGEFNQTLTDYSLNVLSDSLKMSMWALIGGVIIWIVTGIYRKLRR